MTYQEAKSTRDLGISLAARDHKGDRHTGRATSLLKAQQTKHYHWLGPIGTQKQMVQDRRTPSKITGYKEQEYPQQKL